MTLNVAPGLKLPIEGVTETFAFLAVRGVGKRLALDTPLPTPTGWTTVGEVSEGDTLFDDAGHPCTVLAVHPVDYGDSFAVKFTDGSEVVADREHLWATLDSTARHRLSNQAGRDRRQIGEARAWPPRSAAGPVVRTTGEIAETLRHGRERNHSIDNTAPLDLPEVDLPIDPYVLGAWLGDGAKHTGVITSADPEIIAEIERRGYPAHVVPSSVDSGRTPDYRIGRLHGLLSAQGLLYNKHVPSAYLRASTRQRLDLLRGLMDTDGGWIGNGTMAEFAVTLEGLTDAAYELVVSLGMACRRDKRPAKLNGIEHGVSHRIRFTPTMQVFCLPRKAEKWRSDTAQQQRRHRRYIDDVVPVTSVPMRCLTVDSPSSLFLCGHQMVPTHNTHNASVVVEEMLDAGAQVVVLDPLDAWWGLQSSADGCRAGKDIYVFGDTRSGHADMQLDPAAGALIADVVVDEGVSVVLSLRHMSKAKARQFVAEFCERLYHRKGEADRRTPLHVVIDEADAFVPQRLMADRGGYTARAHGSVDDLVRRGRSSGIGVTLISQRAAVVSKDVLTQCSVLVAMRTTSKPDRKALDEWIEAHDPGDRRAEFMATIAGLNVGEAWVWSPAWLDIFTRVTFRKRRTFDSSATPKAGQAIVAPTARARLDLDALGARMAETIERVAASDPAKLRAQITALEHALAARPEPVAVAPDPAQAEYVATLERQNAALRREVGRLRSVLVKSGAVIDRIGKEAAAEAHALAAAVDEDNTDTPPFRPQAAAPARPAAPLPTPPAPPERPATDREPGDQPVLGGGMPREILRVLAHYPGVGRSRSQVALFIGRKASGGGFQNAVSKLRSDGLIEPGKGDPLIITEAGIAAVGTVTPLPTGTALLDFWLAKVGKPGSMPYDILHTLAEATRSGLTLSPAEVAERIGRAATGGGFQNAYSTLRGHGILRGQQLDPEFAAAIGVA